MTTVAYTLKIDGNPASDALLAALQRVEVEDNASMADMVRLRVGMAVATDGASWTMVDDSTFDRLTKVRVDVTVGNTTEPLIEAYVIETSTTFSNQPGKSVLEVVAMDATVLMNLEEKVQAWPNMSDSDIASQIFSGYQLQTNVQDTQPSRSDDETTTIQRGTDIQFLTYLARRNGYDCYVEMDAASGNAVGHFHPPVLQDTPQGVLTVNMGQDTNVDEFRARYEGLRPTTAKANGVEIASVSEQNASVDTSSLRQQGATSTLPSDNQAVALLARTGLSDSSELQTYAQAVVDRSAWSVIAEGELKTQSFGAVLHAKDQVSVRGVGRTFSGTYYVEKVLHLFTAEGHTQRFTLKRTGLGVTSSDSFTENDGAPT